MYPSAERPAYGIFVAEQVEALRAARPDMEIDVYFINPEADGKSIYFKSIAELRNKIDRGGYDLVHVHYGLSGLFMLSPRWKAPVPVVVTLHGGDIQPEQGKRVQVALTRRILRKADCAIALNERMAALASKAGARRVELIPCAVNTALFTPPEEPRPPLAGRNRLSVIFPSAHSRAVKNYPLFCRVVDELDKKYGIKVDETELDAMSRKEIAWALAGADLMLLTSISEGSPQVVKEAMAANLPVVSTRVGDVEHLFKDTRNCAWAEPSELASTVVNVTEGQVTGKSERDRIFELGLDQTSTANRIIKLYTSLLRK